MVRLDHAVGKGKELCGLTPMDDVVLVEVVDGTQDLLDGLRSILFRKFSLLADPVEELASRRKLSDDVVLVLAEEAILVSP